MKTKDLLEYIVANMHDVGFVKGPIFIDGVVWYPKTTEEQLSFARENIIKLQRHVDVKTRLRAAISDEMTLRREDLAYAYDYLDHPEVNRYGMNIGGSSSGWDRPTSKSILEVAQQRAGKIDLFEAVKKEILERVMNPHGLTIPSKERERMTYYLQHLERLVYETNGNWPNSYGMYLTTAGWLTGDSLKVNKWQPASTLNP